ncbi:MAG TPA: glycosyltransferase [Gammaproteobacteria bacterium]|nr:glycosyltransferase [Gammaproteobacteria bacterium]
MRRPLNILTWHVHGSYLYYLAHGPHTLYVPVKPGRPEGYGGRLPGFEWPDTLREVRAEEVAGLDLDCILFQSRKNYELDQYEILRTAQRRLPRIFLEHDPPREHPTDTRHPVDDDNVLLVHVTPFNDLMWDSGRTPTRVVEHGVTVPAGVEHTGEIARAIVVVNGLASRGRRLGRDVFERVRSEVPLDLAGMGAEALGGLGEIGHSELPALVARYRCFFNPIRYTSLGLSICEAMMVGAPIVGLATTELSSVVENGVSGWVDTRVDVLVDRMRELLAEPAEARRLGEGAKRVAQERFAIGRFVRDWNAAFEEVASTRAPRARVEPLRRSAAGHA